MGKKGKKKGKGSGKGKKKGGKKKKGGEPQMTWKEALLAYQINIKEKQMEDVRYEYRALEEKHLRHKERNERLKEEQKLHIKNMLKQSDEVEKKLADERIVDKEEVVTAMMQNWEAERQEEKNVADLKERIARKEAEIVRENKQVDYWREYQARGQHDHGKQVKLLQQEIEDMEVTFQEMSSHLNRTLSQAKSEITVKTDETLEKQKFIATEKAMAKMDKYSRQEVLDNEWLQKEVDMHRGEVEHLMAEVEVLEKHNLAMMSELFECHVDDLKISRNFYLTQFADDENLEETGILEMDLAKLSFDRDNASTGRPQRPKSAIHRAVEDKVFSLTGPQREEEDENSEEESQFDGKDGTEVEEDPFDNYFQFDDEDFDDYLQLGPLELKLLNISGQRMAVHRYKTPPPDELKAKDFNPDSWPVTGSMIQSTLRETPRM